MVEISNQRFFSAILSSHILDPFLEQNADLAELIKLPNHPDIHKQNFDSLWPGTLARSSEIDNSDN